MCEFVIFPERLQKKKSKSGETGKVVSVDFSKKISTTDQERQEALDAYAARSRFAGLGNILDVEI